MASLNKIMLIGNVGRIEVKSFQDGKVANATLAVSESYTKRDGTKVESTEWFNIVIRGVSADVAERYVSKGSPLFVEGKLRTRRYTSRDGEERSVQEVQVDSMVLLGSGAQGSASQGSASQPSAPSRPVQNDDPGDDLPF